MVSRVRGLRGIPLALPLVLTFVGYEEAFDSVETNAILSALVDQGVEVSYVRTLATCYDRCTTMMQLFHRPLTIPIGKRVRQGDNTSTNLFSAAYLCIIKSLAWERVIRVDGRFHSNLRFTGDSSVGINGAETVLKQLNEAGKTIRLRMNRMKTVHEERLLEEGEEQVEGRTE
ncbi:hypothetical protein RB195_001342 [Necator americanus]|uniref:Reverse transcriptase domain-containing protein n=1 Tax=Necator americanus TaxID=51031 RepID=A0ABR1DDV8_NECAM